MSGTTEITFKLRELEGSDLKNFKRAIQWGEEETGEDEGPAWSCFVTSMPVL